MFTDFGAEGPYLGQMEAVLRQEASSVPIINLLSNAPAGQPELAAPLLAALAVQFPPGSVFVCVVDPGVGSQRLPLILLADGRWFVGPDNGLLNSVAQQAKSVAWHIIEWRPERLSASFHGRDLFAPIAARIACSDFAWAHEPWPGPDIKNWSADPHVVIYCDHYGNAITGCRCSDELQGRILVIGDRRLPQARTFSEVSAGQGFWYENSLGLVEIAVNRGRADLDLNITAGSPFAFD